MEAFWYLDAENWSGSDCYDWADNTAAMYQLDVSSEVLNQFSLQTGRDLLAFGIDEFCRCIDDKEGPKFYRLFREYINTRPTDAAGGSEFASSWVDLSDQQLQEAEVDMRKILTTGIDLSSLLTDVTLPVTAQYENTCDDETFDNRAEEDLHQSSGASLEPYRFDISDHSLLTPPSGGDTATECGIHALYQPYQQPVHARLGGENLDSETFEDSFSCELGAVGWQTQSNSETESICAGATPVYGMESSSSISYQSQEDKSSFNFDLTSCDEQMQSMSLAELMNCNLQKLSADTDGILLSSKSCEWIAYERNSIEITKNEKNLQHSGYTDKEEEPWEIRMPSAYRKDKTRSIRLWEYLLFLLRDPRYNPSHIRWEDESNGEFRLVRKDEIARLWGDRKVRGRKRGGNLTPNNFAKGIRTYYEKGILCPVSQNHVYRFGPHVMEMYKNMTS